MAWMPNIKLRQSSVGVQIDRQKMPGAYLQRFCGGCLFCCLSLTAQPAWMPNIKPRIQSSVSV